MQPNEPFIDIERNKSAKLFEWENNNRVRFRAVTDKIKGEGDNFHSTPSDELIITFYSDRNLRKEWNLKIL